MVFKRTSPKRVALIVGVCCVLTFVLLRFVPTVSSRSAALEHDLNQHFLEHQLLQLDASTVSQQVRKTGRLSLASADFRFDLELVPNDLRAPGYRAEQFGADGVGRPINIGPVRTFKGRARGSQGGKQLPDRSEARFTIDETVIEGLIITPTEHYFVEPAQKFSKSALSSDYVIYKESDVVTGVTGDCGVTLSEQVNQRAEAVRLENAQIISQAQPKSNQVFNEIDALSKPANILTPAAVNCASEPISSGQQLNRTLAAGCTFQGGQLIDIFTFSGIAGQKVSITMSSSDFYTQLYLWFNASGSLGFVSQDDNGGGGTDSRIPAGSGMFTLPATSTYSIYATSALPNKTGNYKISFALINPPPANDSLSNAQLITSVSGNIRSVNLGATHETGEPKHVGSNGGASVWYRWQATANGTAIFDTAGSEFDTLLAVYTGNSVGSLTSIAANDDFNGTLNSRVSFAATQGTVYFIAVDGFNEASGFFQLNWNPPVNDDFANAQLITGAFGTVFGSNVGATKQPGEPNHGGNIGGASVWYRWTAPSNGTISVTTKKSNFGHRLVIYAGSSVSALTKISDVDDDGFDPIGITFPTSAGATYHFAVDGIRSNDNFAVFTGNITLSWLFKAANQPLPPAPANDNFANAQIVTGVTGNAVGTNVSASREAGEPDHINEFAGGTVSVWYKWQAPAAGTATFTTSGSSFDTLLAVYRGSSINALTAIASNDDDPDGGIQSEVSFLAFPGQTYYIAIDGFAGATGSTALNWTFPPPPPNDSFSNAQIISATAGSASGTNVGASKESGEPNHAGFTGGASVWYRWQAPVNGTLTFDTAGSNFDTLLGVYSGSGFNLLVEVARNDDALGVQSSVTFSATAGTQYFIAVDGYKTGIGSIKLNWTLDTAAPTPTPTPSPSPLPAPVATPTPPFLQLQIATEADFEYVQSKGGSPATAAQEILSIMNQVEGLYESQLGLTIKITYQSAWNTPGQPYTSTNPSTLLSELANYWNDNRGSVARDVVHMWTAKELDNATIGTAYIEALCRFTGNGRAAYGFSKGVAGLQQIAITAHEIGHNLGASHPNQQVPPPVACDNTVMSSSVNTTPQLDFCPYSANEIANYLAGSTDCLSRDATHLSFAVPKSLPVGPMSDVAVGDFNNDGKQDLAANEGDRIAVLLGSDNGEMAVVFNYPVGASPAAGDFDGDGKQDLVFPSPSGGTVTVLRGNGSGVFEPAGEYVAGKSPSHIVVGDFNVDGNQDLAAINGAGSDISVLLNNGSGGFQAPLTIPAGIGPTDLFVGEFTSDNAPDLLVAGIGPFGAAALRIFRNTGSGNFDPAPIGNYGPVPSEPRVGVGDVNGDGISDVVAAFVNLSGVDPGDRSFVRILLGNGGGDLQSLSSFDANFRAVAGVAIGDFNGDSNGDVVIAGTAAGGGIEVRYANGSSSLTLKTYNVPATGKLAVGDFNGDGNQDLVDLSNASVVLGSTTELQAPHRLLRPFPTAMAAGDFNRDGKQDLAVVRAYDSTFQVDNSDPTATVLFGTGTGDFDAAVVVAQFPSVRMTDVTSGDFNNDGLLDFAFTLPVVPAFIWSPLNVMLGNNNSGFDKQRYDLVSNLTAVTAGDFNRDGKLDLAIAGEGRILLMPGGNNAVFQTPVEIATIGISISDLEAGDFNRDGFPDLVVVHENSVSVLLGASGGGFLPGGNFALPAGTGTVTVGDFNFDHKLDLAVGGISVFCGNGDGTFKAPIAFGGGGLSGIAAADFNGDGKTDIAVASSSLFPPAPTTQANKGSISVLINNSGNSFTGPVNDNFADSRIISGPNGTLAGTTVLATKEIGELNHADAGGGDGGASIWYRWKAPFTGRFYFQTFSSSFPSVIAVYTGTSVGAVSTIAQSTTAVPEYVEFDATAGTTYRIAIDGVHGDTGRTVLTWNSGFLVNDNFAFAREIRGTSSSVNGNNSNFSLEPNEPTLPGATNAAFSAWYRWTAPNTGKVSFTTEPCGDTTRLLGAYTGNFIDTLTPVAVNFDGYRDFDDPGVCDNRTLRFNAIAGATYRIQLRSSSGGPFKLAWNYANPPPNDNFANALVLAGNSGSLTGSNKDATKEPGELNHAGGPGGASIWYRWTAPNSGQVTFDTIGFRNQTTNSFRYLTALLAVYTGSDLNTLTAVTTNATDNKVIFNATAGTTYHIAVDSAPYSAGGYLPGIVPLHWGTKQVANDDFANAQPLTASDRFVPILGSNAGATKETGEPNHAGSIGGASVWYRWTALSTGNIDFVLKPCITCTLPANNARIAVYTGASVNALTPVPVTADNNHTFAAVRGATYFIAVDSNTGTGGTYEFSLVSANVSARNNDFANAQVLSGSAGSVAGDNSGATREPQEPNHANDIGGASVWYQWKAPASGLFTVDTFGSNFDTLLAVYTGNAVNALTVVASSDNARSSAQSRLTFDAKVDATYYIAVDGKSNGVEQVTGLARSQEGFILLNWNNLPAPANDDFASAQGITGVSGNVTGRNTVASKEGGEPNHAANPGGVSVWYQWTAPSSGNFTFNTFSSDFNTLLAVYSGSELTTLTPVSANDDAGASTQSRVTFSAVAGTVYHIAIDGSAGVPGNVTAFSGNVVLSWFPETGITNDNFSLAQQLDGASGSLAATNAGGSKETDEPNHAGDRGGRSLWYSWTAPFSGPVLFTTSGSDFDTLLAIYSGSSVNGLTLVASNDDSPYSDNVTHILTSSLTFTAIAGSTYKIAVDGSGGRAGNFALRWGAEAKITGQVSFIGGKCGSDKKVTMILSGEDARLVTLNGSGTYTFEHLRVGGNYSVRGVSEVSANCLPLFLERAHNSLPLTGNVLDANFVDDGLRGGGSTSNITGRVRNATAVGLNNVAIALSGSASRTVYTDSAGLYQLPNLPAGSYQVTPSKAGVVFSPASMEFNFPVGQSITDADFVAQESFNISGQTRAQNGAGLAGVTVTLSNGTQPVAVQTDVNGYYSFDAAAGGSYTLTAAQPGLGFTPATRTINGLNANQKNVDFTVDLTTPPQLELLLEESETPTTQAAALEALLLLRDPFPVVSTSNLLSDPDHNTRVLLFVKNVQLAPGETAGAIFVHLVGANGQSYDVPAESLFSLSGFDFSQLTFRLPDTLVPGTCTVEIRAHGQVSNLGTIRIRL